MKKNFTKLTVVLLVCFFTSSVFADVITKETFGTRDWDANPTPTEGLTGHNGVTGYYWLTDSITFTTENGHWVAGSDTSVRINSYMCDAPVSTKPWADTSSKQMLGLTAPTRYGGAWDTMTLADIDIKYWEYIELQFGWGKRWNGWVAHDSVVRGLKVEYRVDGGSWIAVDSTLLETPLFGDKWSLADGIYIDETGDLMDIRFTAYFNSNQIGVDDIILMGDYNETGISNLTNTTEFNIYPNPAVDVLNVNLRDITSAQYEIFTVDGSKITNGILNSSLETIDISNLASGIYFINVKYEGKQTTIKFSK